MRELLARVYAALPPLFGTNNPVYVSSGAATGMMESAIRCGTRRRVLSLVAGAFGERFARIAEACGRSVTRLVAPPGEVVSADALSDALEHGEYDAVTAVHVETSTGAIADVASYGRALAGHDDTLLLVDAVSSVGGLAVEMDSDRMDIVLSASQKALALPPGLSFIACSRACDGAGARAARSWDVSRPGANGRVLASGRHRRHAGHPSALRAGRATGCDRARGAGESIRAAPRDGGGGVRVGCVARRRTGAESRYWRERQCARPRCRASQSRAMPCASCSSSASMASRWALDTESWQRRRSASGTWAITRCARCGSCYEGWIVRWMSSRLEHVL